MNRGEIWQISLDPTIGSEIKKTRPCIIINNNAVGVLPLRIIVSVTDWKERYSSANWMVKIESDTFNNLSKTSAIDCFQVRSVSTERFVSKIGDVSPDIMGGIEVALNKVLIQKAS